MPTREEAEAVLQYYPAGSVTVEELMESDYDDDEGYVYYEQKNNAQGVASSNSNGGTAGGNKQAAPTSLRKMQPTHHSAESLKKHVASKVRVDDDYFSDLQSGGGGIGGGSGAKAMNQRVLNDLHKATTQTRSKNDVDRSERATVENVMDPRTRMILYKLVNSKLLMEVNGCVSTGKEANVYFALSGDGTAAAIKIFKTSILVFKDRDQYVTGEYRFQRYCKSNPRKMVRTWAEKEARNLNRLQSCGINAPRVRLLRQHLIVMDFIGEDGWPAPRLKEVKFPDSAAVLDKVYLDVVATVRRMFQDCKLVHGDLSEYNILCHNNQIFIIDVSQSVEHQHPQSLNFLRRDIVNVNTFFKGKGHKALLTAKEFFDVTTSLDKSKYGSTHEEIVTKLQEWEDSRLNRHVQEDVRLFLEAGKVNSKASAGSKGGKNPEEGEVEDEDEDDDEYHDREFEQEAIDADERERARKAQAEIDENVFLTLDIPRGLHGYSEYKHPSKEVEAYVRETMIVDENPEASASSKAKKVASADVVDGGEGSDSSDEEEDESFDDEEQGGDEKERRTTTAIVPPKPVSEMTAEEKKAFKKYVKEMNREKRVAKKDKKNASKNKKKKPVPKKK